MKSVPKIVLSELAGLVMFGSALFLPAWTFAYWQAWLLLAVFVLMVRIPGIYLMRTNPVTLQRRKHGGPRAETRLVQKVVIGGLWLSLGAMFVVSALDHRFGWSSVPTVICLVGDVVVAVGLGVMILVIIQNSYAAATVRVESGQKIVCTGLYSLVRHPMYTGNVIMMLGIPLALGSYWGLVFVIPGVTALVLRIRDEEQLLREELDGYRDYQRMVRYRLLPRVW
jgi:protein-S-isoprenylcysteine O-methyltransferase Ste14